ncbi:hypothetical protein FRACA_910009 [Frankia canadensis]|uniref:Uncharacterized protein n=1 Tax=Frankia canadensis TaxID=1836972 RepID=A0A2I2L2K4_9ACTN|nr:hypothetical protein [Frankia canadensis]SNQ52097.1 hypothetical protein FRACA_910009 [Frankia canadensis]SOU59387.1 hypothetical protein FRACA_910009 [Frankia canadensis]
MDEVTGGHRIALHVVGGSDIGLGRPAPGTTDAQIALAITLRLAEIRTRLDEGDDDHAIFAGTPIGRLVSRLSAAPSATSHPTIGEQSPRDGAVHLVAVHLVLVATRATVPARSGLADAASAGYGPSDFGQVRSTRPIADLVRDYARRHVAQVSVEELAAPTLALGRSWTVEFLHREVDGVRAAGAAGTPWQLLLGAGASGIVLGVMFELLLHGAPFELHAGDDTSSTIEFAARSSPEALHRWLVRHRLYDMLAELDRRWNRLARRQAVDVAWLLTDLTGHRPDDLRWSLDAPARAVLAGAVQASFAEGLARQEITDGAAARTWLHEFALEHTPPAHRDEVLGMLAVPGYTRIAIAPTRAADVAEPLAALLHPDVVTWHDDVKRLSHGSLATVPTPPASVLALQDDWIRGQHQAGPLADYPAWPVGESAPDQRTVLLLRTAATNQEANDAALASLVDGLAAGDILLVEFTTPQAGPSSPHPRVSTAVPVPVDETNVARRPGLVDTCRARLWAALLDVRGADLVDEVAVALPAGPKALVIATMLAAVDFSLHAAAPLRVLTAHATHTGQGPGLTIDVSEDDDRALASLGLDETLAHLAAWALANLDLSVAERLLRRGSVRLRSLAADVATLRRDAFGIVPIADGTAGHPDRTSAAEVRLAIARLRLCATIVDRHPWDTAYLASMVLDHTFRTLPARPPIDGLDPAPHASGPGPTGGPQGKAKTSPHPRLDLWENVRVDSDGGRRNLNAWRNRHPLSHGIRPSGPPRRTGGRAEAIVVPTAEEIRTQVAATENRLRRALQHDYPTLMATAPNPDVLVRQHADLLGRIRAHAGQEVWAARAANGSLAAAGAGTSVRTGAPSASRVSTPSATSTAESK